MAIFAIKNIFEKLVVLKTPVKDGNVLVYDQTVGAFTNVSAEKLNIPLASLLQITSVSSNNSISLIENVSGNSIEFRSLVGKNGILVSETNGTIVIESKNEFQGAISQDSYSIVIDYDDDNSNAFFTVDRVNSTSSKSVIISSLPETFVPSYEISYSSATTFLISNVNFSALGFEDQMLIYLSGTPNGLYDKVFRINQIDTTVSGNRIDLGTIVVSSSFMGTPLTNLKIKQAGIYLEIMTSSSPFFVSGYPTNKPSLINVWKASVTDFPAGTFFNISNTENEILDFNFIVASASVSSNLGSKWITILVDVQTPIPLSADIPILSKTDNYTFQILGNVENTGFKVSKFGDVYGKKFISSALPVNSYELANKQYVDSEITKVIDVYVSSLNDDISSVSAKINNLEKSNKRTLRFFLQYARF